MAFTDAQKENIRFYMGYPQVYIYANPRLENAMDLVGNSATLVTKVQAIIDSLTSANTSLSKALATAGLKRAEEIEWYGNQGQNVVSILKSQGKMYCVQLSVIFGVPLANNVFGTSGYGNDNWSRKSQQMSNGFGFGSIF